MILIARKYNNNPFWCIGRIDHDDVNEWYWNCFDINHDEYDEIFSQGCATNRADAESTIREEWRNQLKYKKEND